MSGGFPLNALLPRVRFCRGGSAVGLGDGLDGAVGVVEHLIDADATAACCGTVAVEGEGAVVVEQPSMALEIDDARMDGEAVLGGTGYLPLVVQGPVTSGAIAYEMVSPPVPPEA